MNESKQVVHGAKLTPILETARQILTEARKPLHVNQIAEIAVASNRNMQLSTDTLADRLAAALAANLNTKMPRFAKVRNKTGGLKRGIYRIKTGRDPVTVLARNKPAPPAVSTNFIGKAGEHAVMSELLFWGYNASLMSVFVIPRPGNFHAAKEHTGYCKPRWTNEVSGCGLYPGPHQQHGRNKTVYRNAV